MAKDYYNILGIKKGATSEEIKKAYRKQAMRHHPDRGGDQARFKEINEAYQILSNPQKRAQYDQFGEAGVGGGFGGAKSGYGGFGGYSSGNYEDIFSGGGFGFGGLGDIFEDFFGSAFSQVQVEIPIKLIQAVLGDTVRFKTSLGEEIELKIPAGTQDGQTFRFVGKGQAHRRGRGDLMVVARVKIPKHLSREEQEIFEKLKDLEQKKRTWHFWQ